MPRVPTVSQPQVQLAALPGVRQQTNIDPDAFGAGLGRAVSGLGNVAGDIYAKERQKADRASVRAAKVEAMQWEQSSLYDREKGAFVRSNGRDAAGLSDRVAADLQLRRNEISGKLTNDAQRAEFDEWADNWELNVMRDVSRHTARKIEAYENEQFKAEQQSLMDRAASRYDNPAAVGEALGEAEYSLQQRAAEQGWSPERLKVELAATRSDMMVNVINGYQAAGRDIEARKFFDANKDQIRGEVRDDVENKVRLGAIKAESDALSRELASKYGSISAARSALDNIKDIDLRDATKSRLSSIYAERESARNKAERDASEYAYQWVASGRSPESMPASIRQTIGARGMVTMRNYSQSVSESRQPRTDQQVYLPLLEQATKNPDAFGKTDLFRYADRLSKSDLLQLLGAQKEINSGKRGPEMTYLDSIEKSARNKFLRSNGKDPNSKGANKTAGLDEFMQAVQSEINQVEVSTGKKASRDEIERISDRLLIQGVTEKRWYGDKVSPAYQIKASDIPASMRAQIVQELQRRGVPVTTGNIQAMFAQMNKQGE